jgi:hypothetical protein
MLAAVTLNVMLLPLPPFRSRNFWLCDRPRYLRSCALTLVVLVTSLMPALSYLDGVGTFFRRDH